MFGSMLPPSTRTILPTLASHQGTPAGQPAERKVAIGDAERPAQGGSKGVDAGKERRERERCASGRVDEQPVRLLVNDRKFPAENSVFLSHQTS